MEIPNPRRILILGPPDSGVIELVRQLTGSAPEPVNNSIAGLSHEHEIRTKYYTANVPIWLDEIGDTQTWHTEFSKPEAEEVIQAVGAIVYTFRRPTTTDDLDRLQAALGAIADVLEHNGGYGGDGAKLAVAMPQTITPWLEKSPEVWDELCAAHGFEYVDFELKVKNEFGEAVGMDRVREALEANDWEAVDDGSLGVGDALDDLDLDAESHLGGLHGEELEMGRELFGLKSAVGNVGSDGDPTEDEEVAQVEELQQTMVKMQAIKDIASSMPEDERKRFAAKAVNDLMKDFV